MSRNDPLPPHYGCNVKSPFYHEDVAIIKEGIKKINNEKNIVSVRINEVHEKLLSFGIESTHASIFINLLANNQIPHCKFNLEK